MKGMSSADAILTEEEVFEMVSESLRDEGYKNSCEQGIKPTAEDGP